MANKTRTQLLAEAKKLDLAVKDKITVPELKKLLASAKPKVKKASKGSAGKKAKAPEVPTLLFGDESFKKSGNLLVFEKENTVNVLEVLVGNDNPTDLPCRVLDRNENFLTMHIPRVCFTNLPSPDEGDEE